MTESVVKYETKENNVVSLNNQSPMDAMALALSKGADLEQLEKMLALQEKWEQMEAKKAYTQAMAEFKANPPKINKDKKVSFNQTHYNHASLGNVTDKINTALAEHGLSAGWKTNQEQSGITVTCTITHKMGYSENTSLTAPADSSGKKNNIQAIGSTISYLQRYTILSLTGLATHDMDDDAISAAITYINDKQVSQITDMINATNTDEPKFLKWMGADSVELIPENLFNKAMAALKAKAA
jgi:hypothetical protein